MTGLLCAPVGLAAGWFATLDLLGSDWSWFPASAGLASLLASSLLWYFFPGRKPGSVSRVGLMLTMASGAVLAHYLAWYIQITGFYICWTGFNGCAGALGMDIINPFGALVAALGFTMMSLLYAGWLTIPLFATLGYFVARKTALI